MTAKVDLKLIERRSLLVILMLGTLVVLISHLMDSFSAQGMPMEESGSGIGERRKITEFSQHMTKSALTSSGIPSIQAK